MPKELIVGGLYTQEEFSELGLTFMMKTKHSFSVYRDPNVKRDTLGNMRYLVGLRTFGPKCTKLRIEGAYETKIR
ncbi:hypothetical protein HZA99_02695 [Candidatus Woesearchaeota archaeon]|nr:hypothetical protein [Candidatus Woesearchaeota archaeon]